MLADISEWMLCGRSGRFNAAREHRGLWPMQTAFGVYVNWSRRLPLMPTDRFRRFEVEEGTLPESIGVCGPCRQPWRHIPVRSKTLLLLRVSVCLLMETVWPKVGRGTPPESVVVSGPCRQPLELNTWCRCPCNAMYWYTPPHYHLAPGWRAESPPARCRYRVLCIPSQARSLPLCS